MEWIVEAETLEDLIDEKVLKQLEHIGHWIFVHPLQKNDPEHIFAQNVKLVTGTSILRKIRFVSFVWRR